MPSPSSSTLGKLFSNNFDSEDLEYLHKSIKLFLTDPDSQKTKIGHVNKNYESTSAEDLSGGKILQNKRISIENKCQPFDYKEEDVSNRNHKIPKSQSKNSLEGQNKSYDKDILSNEILQNGISDEDIKYLQESFNSCKKDPTLQPWISKVHWVDHPPTCDQEDEATTSMQEWVSPNETGCARSTGYRKINKLLQPNLRDQMKYPRSPAKAFYVKNYRGTKQSLSRDARNDQRRLSTAFETVSRSDLLKLNELKFRQKKLRLGKSEIHGFGLFACEPIGPNEIIIEYVGQLIRPIISDLREKLYKSSGLGSYCFKVDEDTIIDATNYGNLNRFVNHSCDPNSYARILMMENQKKIVIYSKRAIKIDEEITYDYKMPLEDEKIKCLCRAPNCKKTLN